MRKYARKNFGVTVKRLLILALLISSFSCTTLNTGCPPCPPENAVIFIPAYGPAIIPKGFFGDKDNWATEEEFDEWLKKQGQTGV